MRIGTLLATTALVVVTGPAFAGDITTAVDVVTDKANDLRGIAWTADGKIVASGHVGTVNEETRTVLLRFNADGTLDTGFSEDGVAEIELAPGRQEQSLGVVSLPQGDAIVAVNAVDEDNGQSIYLLRFDSAGNQKLGPDWGDEQGRVEVVLGWANADNANYPGVERPPVDTAWDLKLDTSSGTEKLVLFAIGSAANGTGRTDNDRYVVRLNADGTPDASFNGGTPHSYHSAGTFGDNIRRGLVEPDGSVLVAGYTNLGDGLANHVVLERLLPDGAPDTSFGGFVEPASSGVAVGLKETPGVAVFNPFVGDGGFAETYGVAKLSDGSYVTTGYGGATAEGRASSLGYLTTTAPDLVTFNVDGTALDSAWGNGGTQAIQSESLAGASSEERGRAIVSLGDDRTIQVGRYGGVPAAYVVLPNGQLDVSQDGGGILQFPSDTVDAQFFNAVKSPDGTKLAMTTNNHAAGARLVVLDIPN